MRLMIVAAAVAAVSLAGCGKKEDSGKPAITATQGGYTVKSGDGTATVSTSAQAAAAAVSGLPDFAPLFPGASLENAIVSVPSENGDSQGSTVTYKVAATPDKVVAFYKEKAEAAGFKTVMNANMGAATMFAATDDATKRGLQVIASGKGDATSVVVTWTKPKA